MGRPALREPPWFCIQRISSAFTSSGESGSSWVPVMMMSGIARFLMKLYTKLDISSCMEMFVKSAWVSEKPRPSGSLGFGRFSQIMPRHGTFADTDVRGIMNSNSSPSR